MFEVASACRLFSNCIARLKELEVYPGNMIRTRGASRRVMGADFDRLGDMTAVPRCTAQPPSWDLAAGRSCTPVASLRLMPEEAPPQDKVDLPDPPGLARSLSTLWPGIEPRPSDELDQTQFLFARKPQGAGCPVTIVQLPNTLIACVCNRTAGAARWFQLRVAFRTRLRLPVGCRRPRRTVTPYVGPCTMLDQSWPGNVPLCRGAPAPLVGTVQPALEPSGGAGVGASLRRRGCRCPSGLSGRRGERRSG